MLGAAQADTLGPQLQRLGRILGGFSIGAYLETAVLVRPGQQHLEILAGTGLGFGNISQHDLASGAVQGYHVSPRLITTPSSVVAVPVA